MAKAGEKLSEDYKRKIGDGVARGRRKPVAMVALNNSDGGSADAVAVLWSDGEVERREVPEWNS